MKVQVRVGAVLLPLRPVDRPGAIDWTKWEQNSAHTDLHFHVVDLMKMEGEHSDRDATGQRARRRYRRRVREGAVASAEFFRRTEKLKLPQR